MYSMLQVIAHSCLKKNIIQIIKNCLRDKRVYNTLDTLDLIIVILIS